MASTNKIKVLMLTLFSFGVLAWAISGSFSKAVAVDKEPVATAAVAANADDYVGSDTCAACHEDQYKNFLRTVHLYHWSMYRVITGNI